MGTTMRVCNVAEGPLPGYRHLIFQYASAAKIIIDCRAYGELGSTRRKSGASINVTTVLPLSGFVGDNAGAYYGSWDDSLGPSLAPRRQKWQDRSIIPDMTNLPSNDNSIEYFAPRIRIAIVIMLATMGALTARLWYLQLIKGESYLERSQSNRVRLFRLPASRGRILDATGQVLAENRPSFTFSILPGELDNPREVIQTCSPILGLTEEKMRGLIERSRSIPKYMTFP